MLKGFRAFISRGNVVDLAVGVVMGVAFSAIVDVLSKEIITPIIGLLGGQPSFANLKVGPVGIGAFIDAIISFLIKAAGLYFLIVLPFNRFAAKFASVAPPTAQEKLLAEIRDLLQGQRGPQESTKLGVNKIS